MSKKTGAIILCIIIVVTIVCFLLFPHVREFINYTGALITLICGIVAFFLWWYPRQVREKEVQEKDIERKMNTILSPISGLCLGRDTELSQLVKDMKEKNILLIKGIAGIGKTTLGLKLRDRLEEKGYETFWHQFNSPSYENLLLRLSGYLLNRGSHSAANLKDQEMALRERFKNAVHELYNYPTVLFLDDFQVLEDDSDFRIFSEYLRNSHIVIMSRIQPKFLMEDYQNLQYLDKKSSEELLRTLKMEESQEVLDKVYEKTRGHPWSLVYFAGLSRVLPARKLLEEFPDFNKEQHAYISKQCWEQLSNNEKDFLMRASAFTRLLNFDALRICSKKNLSEVLISLAECFFIMKMGEFYYIHDIIVAAVFNMMVLCHDLGMIFLGLGESERLEELSQKVEELRKQLGIK